MKIYKYQGTGGIPGLPHEIEKKAGDQMIKEYEEALKDAQIPVRGSGERMQVYLLPGYQLKCALEKKMYKTVTRKESAGKGDPPDPPAEEVGLSDEKENISDKENEKL